MMHTPEWYRKWQRPVIQHGIPSSWNWVVLYPENFVLGDYVDIGAFTLIMAKETVIIEAEAEIGSHCAIYSESTIDGKKGMVIIGKGARIGSHTTIMPGVKIGRNATVGAHSFVPAYTMILADSVGWGVPYVFKRQRATEP